MRVFVTGASGHIGSALVPELLGAGHQVVALARSDSSADLLRKWGVEVWRGDLDDLDNLTKAVKASDAVIHLAFKHDQMRSGKLLEAAEADLHAINAMGAELEGSDKPFIATSGTLMLVGSVSGRLGTEEDTVPGGPRVDAENAVIALSKRGVRSSVVRLPPITHSDLDHHGFAPTLISIARIKGLSGYVGDGLNRWPSVHTLDAAHLYRLALERAPPGTRLHAVADEGVAFRDIARVIGTKLGVPSASVPQNQVAAHFSFLAMFVGLDNPVSSNLTRKLLAWKPSHPGLIEDLSQGHYFSQS